MPVGQGVVRQIGDCYQVGDGKGGERRLRSSCNLRNKVSLAWFVGNGWTWVTGGQRVPGVEMSGALGNARSYEFGDETVYFFIMGGSGKV